MSRHEHQALGISIDLPEGWQSQLDVSSVALLAMEVGAARKVRPSMVLTVERCEGCDVEQYTEASLDAQSRLLQSFHVIDRTPAIVDGRPASRTLGHHDLDARALTIEQWRWLGGDFGFALTASCWTLDYVAVADIFAEAANTIKAS